MTEQVLKHLAMPSNHGKLHIEMLDARAQFRGTWRRRNLSVLTCFFLALLFGALLTQSSHAAVAGRFVYVIDKTAGQVEGFSITPTTGVLKTLGRCANDRVGQIPTSEAVDPTGSYLYVSDASVDQIFGFTINPLTGCLTAIAGSAWKTIGTNPESAHVTADGRFLYVSDLNAGAANIEGFQINAGGVLTGVPGTPFGYGVNQGGLAIDPVGPFLFAADDSGPNGPIAVFQYNAAGTPAFAPGCAGHCPTVTAGPVEMSVSPAGQEMLVLSGAGTTLDSYTINRTTGALTFVNTLVLAADHHLVFVDAFGRYGYVTNSAAATVQPYTITPGGTVAANGAAVALPAGSAPAGVRVDEWGKFVYITLSGTSQIAGFTITANTGKLVAIAGSPWNTLVPGAGPTVIHAVTP